jgi:flagellar basal body-associated protein FliL
MFLLILFVIVALVAFVVLTIVNMKVASSKNNSEKVLVQNENQEDHGEVHTTPIEVDILVKENKEQKNVEQDLELSINDETYRNALKSFHKEVKNSQVGQPKSKMKDSDYRSALHSLSRKTDNEE